MTNARALSCDVHCPWCKQINRIHPPPEHIGKTIKITCRRCGKNMTGTLQLVRVTEAPTVPAPQTPKPFVDLSQYMTGSWPGQKGRKPPIS